ncbi:MAG: hypothetical protein WCG21_00280 [Eubacteriales bacterium]
MISKKIIRSISELQAIQNMAVSCNEDVGIHSLDSLTIVDAKSFIGLFALDFSQPVLIVSESQAFHKSIRDIGEDVE